jgi:hypothetical protein
MFQQFLRVSSKSNVIAYIRSSVLELFEVEKQADGANVTKIEYPRTLASLKNLTGYFQEKTRGHTAEPATSIWHWFVS